MVPSEMIRNYQLVFDRVIGIERAFDPAIEYCRNHDCEEYCNNIDLLRHSPANCRKSSDKSTR